MSTSNNPVVLCEEDYKKLSEIVIIDKKGTESDNTLAYELSRAIVVKNADFPANTIKINSKVRIMDVDTNKEREFQIVMPRDADIQSKKISILTPMAAAIIGFKTGDEVNWKMPAGFKKLKVVAVINES